MSQYPNTAATTSDGGYGQSALSRGPSTATSAGYPGSAGFGTMTMPEPHAAPAVAGAAGVGALGGVAAGMSSKQREAYQERQNNRVGGGQGYYGQQSAAPSGSGANSAPLSPATESVSEGPVTVHEDAGAFTDSEIPPT
jgi:hypothetical protein